MSQTSEELIPLLSVDTPSVETPLPEMPEPTATSPREALERAGRLWNRVAVVTDAGGRLGRAIALALAGEGASLTLAGADEEALEESGRRARELGVDVLTLCGDISQEDFCAEIIRRTREKYGDLHVLINHAEPSPASPTLDLLDAAVLQEAFGRIAFGGMYLVKHAVPLLRPGAAVVNTASAGAYRGDPDAPVDASARAAVLGWTRSLARSLLPRQIRVNAVAPGPVWDASAARDAEEPEHTTTAFTPEAPSGRATTTAEAAACYVFLAAESASALTGQVLHPDGGEVMGG